MARTRTQTWLAVILAPFAFLALAIPGMWVFMKTTATELHPDVQDVPAEASGKPPARWVDVVDRGEQLVRASLHEENLPGLSVAVGVGGEIVWAEGFGFADLEKRVTMNPQHRFRIGTAATVLTAGAAGLLIEEGKLKLDEPVRTYVPQYPAKAWPVTMRRLMAHTAGVVNDDGDESPMYSKHCERAVDGVQYFSEYALKFEPGTKFFYSSFGWILVSAAVETAAGKPLLTFLQERIFAPLGMQDMTAERATEPIANQATFYFPRFMADPRYGLQFVRDLDLSCFAGSSGFLSTPSDLVRYGMAVQGGKLLKQSTVKLLQTSQRLASGEETGYGLGWDIENVTMNGKPERVVGHDGQTIGGMVSSLVTLPERGIVVAVISNVSYAKTFDLAVKIAEAFARKP